MVKTQAKVEPEPTPAPVVELAPVIEPTVESSVTPEPEVVSGSWARPDSRENSAERWHKDIDAE